MIAKGATIRLRDRDKFNKVRALVSDERTSKGFRAPKTDGHALDLMLNMILERFWELKGDVEWSRLQQRKKKAQDEFDECDLRLQRIATEEHRMRERFLLKLSTGLD